MPVLEIITSHWSDWEDLGIQLWLQMLWWSSKRIKAVQRPGAHSGPFISAGLGSLAPPRGPGGLRGSLEVPKASEGLWRSQRVSGGPGGLRGSLEIYGGLRGSLEVLEVSIVTSSVFH